MKLTLEDPVVKTGSAESVYANKYQWLLRWALHFCDGDKEMAEDLVQDTFMRMLSSWESIRDVEHPERFLYTYLKYGFLRLRNADRRQPLQSLDQESELLDTSALASGPRLIEWQEEIRSVVDFLCRRKSTAKSASLLLFRFFHGMFPSEIMLIAHMSRKAVDDSLASSKLEARAYVNQNSSTRAETLRKKPAKGVLFVASKPQSILSTEDMIVQLLQVIYAAGDGDCLSYTALRERYSEGSKTPIDCWLLSHIVSCRRCFDLVEEFLRLPPRGSRPLEDVLGYAPKAEAKKTRLNVRPVSAAMRSIAGAKDRYRAALDLAPASIMLIVNGVPVASRDVSSSANKLTVDLRASEATEMIEVVSEHAVLLAVPILTVPPDSTPVQRFVAKLGNGRSVVLCIEFNPVGVRVHVVYSDPFFLEALLSDIRSAKTLPSEDVEESSPVTLALRGGGVWLRELFRQPFGLWLKFALLLVGVGALSAFLLIHRSQVQPQAVVAQAVAALAKRPVAGIEEQKVRITSQGASVDRTLHTDLAHKLRSKRAPLSPEGAKLQKSLETAHVAWNDPLSPVGFNEWEEEQRGISDSSITKHGEFLTVTTKVSSGAIREESLTLNAENLHAVGRMVRFSDSTDIQIAELESRIIPLAESDPAWFEAPLPAVETRVAAPVAAPQAAPYKAAAQPTPGELDVAELNVLLALAELHADGQERLAIKRRSSDILVEGLVASTDRKMEIEKRIRMIPKTSSLIRTFANLEANVSAQPGPSSVVVSESTATPSPLEVFSAKRHLTADEVRTLHTTVLQAAIELRRSATELQQLSTRFPADSLTQEAASLQTILTRLYAARVQDATAKEQQVLQTFGVAAAAHQPRTESPVSGLALENAQLCFELISQQDATPRSAEGILQDLAVAVAALNQASGGLVPSS